MQKMALIKESRSFLKGNYIKGILLFLLILLTYLLIYTFSFFAVLWFKSYLDIDVGFLNITNSLPFLIIFVILYLFLFLPFVLGVKRWYFILDNKKHKIKEAFYFFKQIKRYFLSVYFIFVKKTLVLLIFLFSFLPIFVLVNSFLYALEQNKSVYGTEFVTLAVLTTILFVLLLLIFLFLLSSLLLFDYIFISSKTKNPFKALAYSFNIFSENKLAFIKTGIKILPCLIACILIFPIIFLIPKIKSVYALFAKKCLTEISEENYVKT